MKQIINFADSEVKTKIVDAPIPEPSAKQVLIKVVVSGSNPKDWKAPEYGAAYNGPDDDSFMARCRAGVNQGDDIAGIVEEVGTDVIEFKVCGLQSWIEVRRNQHEDRKAIGLQRSMRWDLLEVRKQSMH
jgi:NADPH:quinone reductase-like Zn-dependent oxidoreductase